MSGGGRRSAQRRAVEELASAYARLAKARIALARASVVGQPPTAAHAAYAALATHRDRILAVPGVVGVGLGLRARREPVLSVFVRSAEPRTKTWDDMTMLAAEPAFGIATEIVPFGELVTRPPPTAALGEELLVSPRDAAPTTALAPGDGIGELAPASRGTLGLFGRMTSGESVGITAMHLVSASAVADGDPPIPLVQRDSLSTAGIAIGAIDRGTRVGVDAARVRLAPAITPDPSIPAIGPVNGWRWAIYPGDIGTGVALRGAASQRIDGVITHIDVDFPAFHLSRTLIAQIPTREGDSGAALVDGSGFVLGFLVGSSNLVDSSLRLFSPTGLVLESLDCNIV